MKLNPQVIHLDQINEASIQCAKFIHILKKAFGIQPAHVISNSKGLSEIHRDIRTSTYQISRIEKIKSNNQMPQIHM